MGQPIKVKEGQVVSTTSGAIVNFNGYLADENYFTNSGGGGNNSGGGGSSTNDDGFGDFTDTQVNGFRFFYIEQVYDIYESDSSSGFTNLLYESRQEFKWSQNIYLLMMLIRNYIT